MFGACRDGAAVILNALVQVRLPNAMNQHEIELLDCVNVPSFALEVNELDRPVYVAFNKHAQRSANLKPEQIIGRTALEAYPGRFGKMAYARHCEALASGNPSTYELTLRDNGRDRYIRTHLEPVLDANGNVRRVVGTSEEITAEVIVRSARSNSIWLNTELGEFVSLTTLDLKNPIRNVSALADSIRLAFQDQGNDKLQLVDMLENVATKAMAVIDEVLEHAKSPNPFEAVDEFELTDLCEEQLLVLDPTDRHLAQIEACRLFGDRLATQTVIRNLMDTAMGQQTGEPVEIMVTAEAYGQESFQIMMETSGDGFSDAALVFLAGGERRQEFSDAILNIRRVICTCGGTISAGRRAAGDGAIIRFTLPGAIVGLTFLSPMDN